MNTEALLAAIILIICTHGHGFADAAEDNDVYAVVSDVRIRLSDELADAFRSQVGNWHFRSEIYKYPAAPIAQLEYKGRRYSMHGNAFTLRVTEDEEHLWVGPFSQALIIKLGENGYEMESALKAITKDDLDKALIDPPGAYPGGGPAPLVNQNRK